jgi:hypothetical protein
MHKLIAGLAAGLALLVAVPPAVAAPVTVDLRIEGANSTLFEGPVTTDVRPFRFTGDATPHECDATVAESGGTSSTPVPTRGAAIAQAAEQMPFSLRGDWSDMYGNPTINEVAGENVAYDAGTGRFLAEYKNGVSAQVGACGDPISSGDRVLFAFAAFDDRPLALTGPASARPGTTATVKVTDAGNGSPVSGATVGGHTTGADGTAVVGPFAQRGDNDLKAGKTGTIRSNRLRVCVSDGSDGFCGAGTGGGAPGAPVAHDTVAPATALTLRSGAVFSRRKAPRLLRGSVDADPSGLLAVKLRLTRTVGKKCSYFSGRRERFLPMHCGHGSFFKIGDRADWSYLLPKRLGRGKYVLEAKAIDGAYNRGPVKRVRFRVR